MARVFALVGGAGFIGHHLAIALKERGDLPVIVDSLSVNNLYAIKAGGPVNPRYRPFLDERQRLLRLHNIEQIVADATDYHQLSRILDSVEPDSVVHMSAVAHIDRSNKDPWSTISHTLRTLENTLDVSEAIKARHVTFLSSSTVYGDFSAPVLDETAICRPRGMYGSLKYSGELIARAYHDLGKIPVSIVRPCALYGPRCVSGRVVQKFIEAALEGRPITIFGTGEEHEDFTYVDDTVAGILKVLDEPCAVGETFNITAGNARSLGELASIVQTLIPGTTIEHKERDPQKPHRGTLSIDKARRMLDYQPQYQLEAGVAKYIDWYRSIGWSR